MLNKANTLDKILEIETKIDEDVLGSICLQLILVDVIKELELLPTGIFGDISGKIVTAYYYNVIGLEESVSIAIKFIKQNFGSNMNLQTLLSYSNDKELIRIIVSLTKILLKHPKAQ